MSSKRLSIGEKYPHIVASELRILSLEAEVNRLRTKMIENTYNMEKVFEYINTTLKSQLPLRQPPDYSVEASQV